MADNKHHQSYIDRARELLSPYLDDEVTPEERMLVEQALSSSAELRREIEGLHQTVTLLKALPPVAAPHPFTLSEADFHPAARQRGGFFFGLPNWAGGLVAVAATLACVMAIIFNQQQLGNRAPAEIAVVSTLPLTENAAGEAEQQAAPAEAEPEEKMMMAPPAEEETEQRAGEQEADAPSLKQEIPEEAPPQAPPAPESAGAAAESQPAPMPTPSPLPTPPPSPSAAAAMAAPAQERTTQEETAAQDEATTAESAPSQAKEPSVQSTKQSDGGREATPRPVEINNLKLQLKTGFIQIEGTLPAEPGVVLNATLLRNGEPFDAWVDPMTQQAIVQPGGYFSMTLRAAGTRTDQDLAQAEPASYQVVLTSTGNGEPVTASVFFDTFEPPAASPTPAPTSTPVALVEPSPLPAVATVRGSVSQPRQLFFSGQFWPLGGVVVVAGLAIRRRP